MSMVNGRYDPELRMFADGPREPDRKHLAFLRWLAEHGRLEHPPVGRSSGEYRGGPAGRGGISPDQRLARR